MSDAIAPVIATEGADVRGDGIAKWWMGICEDCPRECSTPCEVAASVAANEALINLLQDRVADGLERGGGDGARPRSAGPHDGSHGDEVPAAPREQAMSGEERDGRD